MKPFLSILGAGHLLLMCSVRAADAPLDLGVVTEKHVMIPMRDGKHLSAWLYFPPGNGPWPAIFEQRYADIRGAGSRKAAAKFAESGFVIGIVNYRGSHESEGQWVGYRALAWGEHKDGYDICEWLAKQSWCTGKVGTYGGSQAGYAQNFLAVTQPPHLVAQYMTDTGLSLYQEGYRIGGVTRPERYKAIIREVHQEIRILRRHLPRGLRKGVLETNEHAHSRRRFSRAEPAGFGAGRQSVSHGRDISQER